MTGRPTRCCPLAGGDGCFCVHPVLPRDKADSLIGSRPFGHRGHKTEAMNRLGIPAPRLCQPVTSTPGVYSFIFLGWVLFVLMASHKALTCFSFTLLFCISSPHTAHHSLGHCLLLSPQGCKSLGSVQPPLHLSLRCCQSCLDCIHQRWMVLLREPYRKVSLRPIRF